MQQDWELLIGLLCYAMCTDTETTTGKKPVYIELTWDQWIVICKKRNGN